MPFEGLPSVGLAGRQPGGPPHWTDWICVHVYASHATGSLLHTRGHRRYRKSSSGISSTKHTLIAFILRISIQCKVIIIKITITYGYEYYYLFFFFLRYTILPATFCGNGEKLSQLHSAGNWCRYNIIENHNVDYGGHAEWCVSRK